MVIGNCVVESKEFTASQALPEGKEFSKPVLRDVGSTIVDFNGNEWLKVGAVWSTFYKLVKVLPSKWDTDKKEIGDHKDWKAYKEKHIVGNEDSWNEEGEWNVFCADRGIA